MKIKKQKIYTIFYTIFIISCPLFIYKTSNISVNLSINASADPSEDSYCEHLWDVMWGDAGYDIAFGVVIDNLDNIYVTGQETLPDGYKDMCLVKFNASGGMQWNITWGGLDVETPYDIAIDSLNNIYVTGETYSYGPDLVNAFVVKYNSGGLWEGNDTFSSSWHDCGRGIAINSLDEIYIVGKKTDEAFLVKYNSQLEQEWNKTFKEPGSSFTTFEAIAIDSSDDLCVLGEITTGSGKYLHLSKYNLDGEQQWNITWGSLEEFAARDIAVDLQNNIYVVGLYDNFSSGDLFLSKYNTSGVLQWMTLINGYYFQHLRGITIDSTNNIYLAGTSNNEIGLIKYNSSGFYKWHYRWDASPFWDDGNGYDVALDSSGDIYVAGKGEGIQYDHLLVKFREYDFPTFDQLPINQIIEYGLNFTYDINASHEIGIDYFWINDTSHFSTNNDGIISNNSKLKVNEYCLEVRAYNFHGKYCSSNFKVIVEDTTAPTWLNTFYDHTIKAGETFRFEVKASDLSDIDHYWINATSKFNINNDGLIRSITYLGEGIYWIEIRAYDPYDNYCTAKIKITVEASEQGSPTILGCKPSLLLLIGSILIAISVICRKRWLK